MTKKEQVDLGWEGTKGALDFWASELLKRFDETHGNVAEESPFGDLDAGYSLVEHTIGLLSRSRKG